MYLQLSAVTDRGNMIIKIVTGQKNIRIAGNSGFVKPNLMKFHCS
jgi:hypothetical protein